MQDIAGIWLSREETLSRCRADRRVGRHPPTERSLAWTRDPLATVARLESRMLGEHRAQLATSELRACAGAGLGALDLGITRGPD